MKTNSYLLVLVLLFLINTIGFSQSWKTYPYTPSGSLISFPQDEGHHINEPVEWWYTTGHVVGNTTGKNYSYMLSYFYFPQAGFDGFRILNLSDDDSQQFFRETKLVNYNILATDSLHIEADVISAPIETWVNKTDANGNMIPFEYTINATSDNGALDLEYIALKPPLILGDDGLFNQGANAYTYYYSQTKNSVTGTLSLNGFTETVSGTSWIDRQYGSFNPLNSENYEWLSIQLSNDMDINLWNLFTDTNTIPDQLEYRLLAAYVNDNTQYTTKDFQLERLAFYCTSDELKCYSQKWRLTSAINNLDLIITTLYNDSEVVFPLRFYEGSTTITGTVNGTSVTGIGFAELLHSYEVPELSITNPINGSWSTNEPIMWQLSNPDEGMPLKYDVEYAIGSQTTFTPIVQEIIDTSYLWENPPINNGDDIWFKILGYSIDKTIIGETISTNSSQVTLSIDEIFSKENIKIFPNPMEKEFTIKMSEIVSGFNYQIFDISGQELMAKEINDNTLFNVDVRNLTSGVYFIKLSSNNKKFISKFIVK